MSDDRANEASDTDLHLVANVDVDSVLNRIREGLELPKETTGDDVGRVMLYFGLDSPTTKNDL